MSSRPHDIASRVIKGHACQKHLTSFNALGIHTVEEYRQHIINVLKSPDTICVSLYQKEQPWRKADIFYHEMSNTFIADPANKKNEPTAHRPLDGEKHLQKKLREAARIEGAKPIIYYGLRELEAAKTHKNQRHHSAAYNAKHGPGA